MHIFLMPEKKENELPRELRMLYTKAKDALQRENFDYAIELFMQILNKEPSNIDARTSLRMAQRGKSGARGGFFKRAFSSASSSPLVAKGQLALRKNPLEAMEIAEQILNSDANSSGGHRLLAEAALAAELPQTAVMSLEILYKDSPKDKDAGMKLAEALALAGNTRRAEAVYEDLRREYPNDNEIFMALKNLSARKTLNEGGYEALADGKGSYRDILKDKEQSVRLEQESRQVKAQDSTTELIKDWETRLQSDPNNLKLLRNLAETYAQRKDFDRSLGYFDRMSAIDGGNDAGLQKQISEIKVNRFDDAASKLDPAAPDYAEKSGQIKAERQAFRLEECKARAEKYPTDLQIRFELGVLYFEAGKITEAQVEFQKAQNNPHRRIQSITYLAKCFAARGMNDLAAKRIQEALKEKPAFDDEKKDLVHTLGVLLEKMGKKEEAMEQFKAIYEIDSGYRDIAKRVEDYYSAGGSI
jgi:tetratricopeptide (TPR) repeat protein